MEEQIQSATTPEVAAPVETVETIVTPETSAPDLSANPSDVADPKPERDLERDSSFAQLRREKEAAEAEAKRIAAQKKSMDDMIAQQYGKTHGIHTFEQYQEAVAKQEAETKRQSMRDAGLPDDVIDKLSKVDEIEKRYEQERFQQTVVQNFNELKGEYPDIVKSPDDVAPEVWAKWNDGKSGISLTDAYFLVNRKTISEKQAAAAKQAALNNANSKNHMRPSGGEGGSDIDTTVIPPETLKAYRSMFPKMTDKQFLEHFKRSQGG